MEIVESSCAAWGENRTLVSYIRKVSPRQDHDAARRGACRCEGGQYVRVAGHGSGRGPHHSGTDTSRDAEAVCAGKISPERRQTGDEEGHGFWWGSEAGTGCEMETIKMARPLRKSAGAGWRGTGWPSDSGGKRLVCEFARYRADIGVWTFNPRQRRTHVGTLKLKKEIPLSSRIDCCLCTRNSSFRGVVAVESSDHCSAFEITCYATTNE